MLKKFISFTLSSVLALSMTFVPTSATAKANTTDFSALIQSGVVQTAGALVPDGISFGQPSYAANHDEIFEITAKLNAAVMAELEKLDDAELPITGLAVKHSTSTPEVIAIAESFILNSDGNLTLQVKALAAGEANFELYIFGDFNAHEEDVVNLLAYDTVPLKIIDPSEETTTGPNLPDIFIIDPPEVLELTVGDSVELDLGIRTTRSDKYSYSLIGDYDDDIIAASWNKSEQALYPERVVIEALKAGETTLEFSLAMVETETGELIGSSTSTSIDVRVNEVSEVEAEAEKETEAKPEVVKPKPEVKGDGNGGGYKQPETGDPAAAAPFAGMAMLAVAGLVIASRRKLSTE